MEGWEGWESRDPRRAEGVICVCVCVCSLSSELAEAHQHPKTSPLHPLLHPHAAAGSAPSLPKLVPLFVSLLGSDQDSDVQRTMLGVLRRLASSTPAAPAALAPYFPDLVPSLLAVVQVRKGGNGDWTRQPLCSACGKTLVPQPGLPPGPAHRPRSPRNPLPPRPFIPSTTPGNQRHNQAERREDAGAGAGPGERRRVADAGLPGGRRRHRRAAPAHRGLCPAPDPPAPGRRGRRRRVLKAHQMHAWRGAGRSRASFSSTACTSLAGMHRCRASGCLAPDSAGRASAPLAEPPWEPASI